MYSQTKFSLLTYCVSTADNFCTVSFSISVDMLFDLMR